MDRNYEPYVEFKDLPNTDTPIDADNLNTLQTLMRQDIADNQSVPYGGTTGQVLKKTSDADYDIAWENETVQVVDSLDGNSTTMAPSQNVVKTEISNLKYNLVTNGDAVKTGRLVDGKEEYVKRYKANIESISSSGNTRAGATINLGFTLSSTTIVSFEGYIVSNTDNIFSLDTNNFNGGDYGKNYIYLSSTKNTIVINCNSSNYNGYAVVNIYFTYKT